MEEPFIVFVQKRAVSAVSRMAKPVGRRDRLEEFEEYAKRAGINEPDRRGERGAVGAVMAKDRHESDVSVDGPKLRDPPHHYVEYCQIDGKQVREKARKEEKQGDVQQGRQHFKHPRQAQAFEAFDKVFTNSSPLIGTVTCMGYLDVSMRPLQL